MLPKEPQLPKDQYDLVDVRDVAAAHISAIQTEEAKNKRFILVDKLLWSQQMAEPLKKEFEGQGFSIVTEMDDGEGLE